MSCTQPAVPRSSRTGKLRVANIATQAAPCHSHSQRWLAGAVLGKLRGANMATHGASWINIAEIFLFDGAGRPNRLRTGGFAQPTWLRTQSDDANIAPEHALDDPERSESKVTINGWLRAANRATQGASRIEHHDHDVGI